MKMSTIGMPSRAPAKPLVPLLGSVLAAVLLGACAVQPSGPSVMALPGSTKTFDQFRADDADCRSYASQQIGGSSANDAATESGIRSAAIGTAVGAVAGAAIGGRDAAGVGAGVGLLTGSLAGAGAGQSSARGTQRNYDHAYVQCMYARGERVPVSGRMGAERSQAQPSAPAYSIPPPPPWNPPPPPPGVMR